MELASAMGWMHYRCPGPIRPRATTVGFLLVVGGCSLLTCAGVAQEFTTPQPPQPAYLTGAPAADRPTELTAELADFRVPKTLEELEALALSSHPAIAAAEARVEAARGESFQSGLGPNPLIGYSGQQLFSGGVAEQHGLLVQQTWIRGNKLGLNRAVGAREVDAQLAQLDQHRNQIRAAVRLAYYGVLAAQQMQVIARELVATARETVSTAERLVAAGETDRSLVTQARIDLEQVQIEEEQAAARLRAAWRMLAAASTLPTDSTLELVGDLENCDWPQDYDSLLQELLAGSPELRWQAVQVAKFQAVLARAQVEPVPDVTVQSILQYDNSTAHPNGALQVTFPVPRIDRNQGAIRAASAQIVAAQRSLEQQELALSSRMATVWSDYEMAMTQVRRYRESVRPLLLENMQFVRQGIQAGELNVARLLVVQREYAVKESVYLAALMKSWQLRAQIECYLPALDAALTDAGWAPILTGLNW